MTLHTRVATLAPFDLHEFHEWFNRECLGVDHALVKVKDTDNTKFDRDHFDATMGSGENKDGTPCGERRWIPDGTKELGNEIGQGFDAWFWMDYRPDGWLRPKQMYSSGLDDEVEDPSLIVHTYCEDDCTELHECDPPMCVEINFDTAYGHKPGELNCSQLHTLYIARIGAWMDERGIEWRWYNEFTGEWHDRYDALETLAEGGANAMDWFRNVVQPVIGAEVAAAGGTIHWEGEGT